MVKANCSNCIFWSNWDKNYKAYGDCTSEHTYERKTPSYHYCTQWYPIDGDENSYERDYSNERG